MKTGWTQQAFVNMCHGHTRSRLSDDKSSHNAQDGDRPSILSMSGGVSKSISWGRFGGIERTGHFPVM
jgi:hypothetical protein